LVSRICGGFATIAFFCSSLSCPVYRANVNGALPEVGSPRNFSSSPYWLFAIAFME